MENHRHSRTEKSQASLKSLTIREEQDLYSLDIEDVGSFKIPHNKTVLNNWSHILKVKVDDEFPGKKLQNFFHNNPNKNNIEEDRLKKELLKTFGQINHIQDFPTAFLTLQVFRQYQTCHFFVQERGKMLVDHLYNLKNTEHINTNVEATNFNKMFNLIKKSKNKIFNQNLVPQVDLKFVGSFLANVFNLKNHNVILIISRHDFLAPTTEEIATFDRYCLSLDIFLEKVIGKETEKEKKKNLLNCLIHYPESLALFDHTGNLIFKNFELAKSSHIKKIVPLGQYKLILYDTETSDTSSELFHHQRVSLLGELLNTLRHELNNPLFGLKLTSDLLAHETQDDEQKSILREIALNVTRSQNIIENFTNLYTNAETYQVCTIKRVLDEALTIAKSEIRQVRIGQYYAGDLSPEFRIYTNPTSLVQIIFNLIINSAQAMRVAQIQGAQIVFNFKKDSQFFIIEMTDNGPGVPAEIQERLFEPFFTTKPNGTGLGLAITTNLIKHLKGTIAYQQKEECGASFLIQFPLLTIIPKT